jgi:NADPH:quinone reductase-like Zn-dependent oxidoreductase
LNYYNDDEEEDEDVDSNYLSDKAHKGRHIKRNEARTPKSHNRRDRQSPDFGEEEQYQSYHRQDHHPQPMHEPQSSRYQDPHVIMPNPAHRARGSPSPRHQESPTPPLSHHSSRSPAIVPPPSQQKRASPSQSKHRNSPATAPSPTPRMRSSPSPRHRESPARAPSSRQQDAHVPPAPAPVPWKDPYQEAYADLLLGMGTESTKSSKPRGKSRAKSPGPRTTPRSSPANLQRGSPQTTVDSYEKFKGQHGQRGSDSPSTVWSDPSSHESRDNTRTGNSPQTIQSDNHRGHGSDHRKSKSPRVLKSVVENTSSPGPEERKGRPPSRSKDRPSNSGYNLEHGEVEDVFATENGPRRSRSRSADKRRTVSSDRKDPSKPYPSLRTPRNKGEVGAERPHAPSNHPKNPRTPKTDWDHLHLHQRDGAPLGLSMHGGAPAISVPLDTESKCSNLSESIDGNLKLKQRIKKVACQSKKNVKIAPIHRPPATTPRSKIPERLPGKEESYSSESSDSETDDMPETDSSGADFGGCMMPAAGGMTGNRASSSEDTGTSESSHYEKTFEHHRRPVPKINKIKNKIEEFKREEFEGHYMYVAYSRFGEDAKDVIQLCEHETIPSANSRAGEVLVKVMASTVSTTDCEIRRGEWGEMRLNPYIIPGAGLVGKIHHTEKKSPFQSLKPGDMVVSLVKAGSNARYACIQRDQLVKVPKGVDPASAVCLVETYLGAFQALHLGHRTGIRYRPNSMAGKSILILGGASCLGRALIELSIAAGAASVYATAKEKEFITIAELGAIPLSPDPQQWLTLIGRQIEIIVSVKGGLVSEEVTKEHLQALSNDGQVTIIGQRGTEHTVEIASPSPQNLLCTSGRKKLQDRSQSYNVFDHWAADYKQSKKDLAHLLELLQGRLVNPQVLERIPLSKVAKAQSIVEAKRLSGFIVCEPWHPLSGAIRY